MTTSLAPKEVDFFNENGYLIGLPPVYSRQEMVQHNEKLKALAKLLGPDESYKDIREWHETSSWLFDIVMNPKIHDMVEGILGPDFYIWGSNFFAKEPRSTHTVGWHQDAYYWPMAPHHTVTVWLAFTDVDEQNGAMKIVPGSHKAGIMKHQRRSPGETSSVLTLELEGGAFREDTAVSMCLRAGEVSLHDDRAAHGSPANPSDRWRTGLTIRYSGTDVKNDLSVNPNFKTYLCRGVDRYHLNPVGARPVEELGRPSFRPISREEAGAS